MKATITIDGELIVIAENDTEAFALQCWTRSYNPCAKSEDMSLYPSSISIDVHSFAQELEPLR